MLRTEPSTTTPSTRVIEAVAEANGVSTSDLPPLYDVVDPEALDGFVHGAAPGSEIEFEYFDTDVSVTVRDNDEFAVRIE